MPSPLLRSDRFGLTTGVGECRNLASGLALPILFSIMKFTPITHVQPGKLRLRLVLGARQVSPAS
jgi:hypothetical protein